MDEIIHSILQAEKKADEIVKKAEDDSKNLLINAGVSAENEKISAINSFKKIRKEEILKSQNKADEEYNVLYNKMIDESIKNLNDAKKNVNDAINEVFNLIIK